MAENGVEGSEQICIFLLKSAQQMFCHRIQFFQKIKSLEFAPNNVLQVTLKVS